MPEQPSYRRTLRYSVERDETTCPECHVTVAGDWTRLTCPHGPSHRLHELAPEVTA